MLEATGRFQRQHRQNWMSQAAPHPWEEQDVPQPYSHSPTRQEINGCKKPPGLRKMDRAGSNRWGPSLAGHAADQRKFCETFAAIPAREAVTRDRNKFR